MSRPPKIPTVAHPAKLNEMSDGGSEKPDSPRTAEASYAHASSPYDEQSNRSKHGISINGEDVSMISDMSTNSGYEPSINPPPTVMTDPSGPPVRNAGAAQGQTETHRSANGGADTNVNSSSLNAGADFENLGDPKTDGSNPSPTVGTVSSGSSVPSAGGTQGQTGVSVSGIPEPANGGADVNINPSSTNADAENQNDGSDQPDVTGSHTPWYKQRNAQIVMAVGAAIICFLFVVVVVFVINLLTRKDPDDFGVEPSPAPSSMWSWAYNSIIERGSLRCGISGQRGYSLYNFTSGTYEGFDTDLCVAIAAAIFGADNAKGRVEFIELSSIDRFESLNKGDVDVLGETTHTAEREVREPTTGKSYSFSVPYLYNGLQFGGLPEFVQCVQNANNTGICEDTVVCVLDGATHFNEIKRFNPEVDIVTPIFGTQLYDWFIQGRCNVIASEQLNVAESTVRREGYSGEYVVGDKLYSKEPLALVTRDDDPRWTDFVGVVLQGLLAAEGADITKATADRMGPTTLFGDDHTNMLIDAVQAVGNYGEIYNRHIQELVPRSVANSINIGISPLFYPLPFGSLEPVSGFGPTGGVLGRIRRRGVVFCGVEERSLFARRNETTDEWEGMEIEYCRALSAAVFGGDATRIQIIELEQTTVSQALASEEVDVVATDHALDKDVQQFGAPIGLTYSPPIFFEGTTFGGIPPFAACADRLDTSSSECQGLIICVVQGTEHADTIVDKLFHNRFTTTKESFEAAVAGLVSGQCNVIAGPARDVAETNVRRMGYGTSAQYQTGANRFSKRILALATREDDALWSNFVFWTVTALMYAEEEGITQATAATAMPEVHVFGSSYFDMFRHAVAAVGSTSELYNRTIGGELLRGGPNGLNFQLSGPQHCSLPGLIGFDA